MEYGHCGHGDGRQLGLDGVDVLRGGSSRVSNSPLSLSLSLSGADQRGDDPSPYLSVSLSLSLVLLLLCLSSFSVKQLKLYRLEPAHHLGVLERVRELSRLKDIVPNAIMGGIRQDRREEQGREAAEM